MTAMSLERVLARTGGGTTLRIVRNMVKENLAQKFVASDGTVVITQIAEEPNQTVVLIWLCEGNLAGAFECLDDIEAFAKRIGASMVRITGRAGWVRCLKDRGYSEVARVLERPL